MATSMDQFGGCVSEWPPSWTFQTFRIRTYSLFEANV